MESARHAQTSQYSPITSLAKFGDRVATRMCVLLAAQGARAGPAASAAAAQIGVRAATCPRSRPGGPAGRGHTQRPPRPASVLPAGARASGQAPTSSRRAVGRGGWPTPLCSVWPSGQTALEELSGDGHSTGPGRGENGGADLRTPRPCPGAGGQDQVPRASSRAFPSCLRGHRRAVRVGLGPPLAP